MFKKVRILVTVLTFLVSTQTVSFTVQNKTDIYFISGKEGKEILCPASRVTEETKEIEIIKLVLAQLKSGPSGVEKQDGLKSFLPNDIEIKEVELIERIAIISFDCSTWKVITLSDEEIIKTIAQLVYTLTELPFIERVIFIARGRLVFVKQDDRYIYELGRNLKFLSRFLRR